MRIGISIFPVLRNTATNSTPAKIVAMPCMSPIATLAPFIMFPTCRRPNTRAVKSTIIDTLFSLLMYLIPMGTVTPLNTVSSKKPAAIAMARASMVGLK